MIWISYWYYWVTITSDMCVHPCRVGLSREKQSGGVEMKFDWPFRVVALFSMKSVSYRQNWLKIWIKIWKVNENIEKLMK